MSEADDLAPTILLKTVNFPLFSHRSNDDKVNFNQRIALGCSSSWVKYPKHLDLMYSARHFLIQIDPCGLGMIPNKHTRLPKNFT